MNEAQRAKFKQDRKETKQTQRAMRQEEKQKEKLRRLNLKHHKIIDSDDDEGREKKHKRRTLENDMKKNSDDEADLNKSNDDDFSFPKISKVNKPINMDPNVHVPIKESQEKMQDRKSENVPAPYQHLSKQ